MSQHWNTFSLTQRARKSKFFPETGDSLSKNATNIFPYLVTSMLIHHRYLYFFMQNISGLKGLYHVKQNKGLTYSEAPAIRWVEKINRSNILCTFKIHIIQLNFQFCIEIKNPPIRYHDIAINFFHIDWVLHYIWDTRRSAKRIYLWVLSLNKYYISKKKFKRIPKNSF